MKPKSLPSRLFSRQSSASSSAASETVNVTGKYQRHVDCVDHISSSSSSSSEDNQQVAESSVHSENYLRELQFAFQPDKYEVLRDDDEDKVKRKEEKKRKKKENYKKVKKNVGKALRATWKCFMLGLYNFSLGYSTPITTAATFVPDFRPERDWMGTKL
ncbi:unnamed protein product [Ophioblennius macclurei]